jgi:glycosyltransferase involved in cell wall biosynthesis
VRDMGAHTSEVKRRIQRMICRMATAVVANADAVRDWLTDQGIAKEKVHVIRNGVVFRDLPQASDGPTVRQEFGISAQEPIVGAVCRLTRVKGVEYLVEAAGLLRSRHANAHFIILGDGESKPALMQRVKELGLASRFHFAGYRTDTQRFLREFDISILPSLTEGLSNTLMESMAAGLPVVATRVGGTPELVSHEQTGLLVNPQDAASLGQSISRLLDNPVFAQRLGAAGRSHILDHFSMEQSVSSTETLYSELLQGRAA